MAYADIPAPVLAWWEQEHPAVDTRAWTELWGPLVPRDLLRRGTHGSGGDLFLDDPAALLAAANSFAAVLDQGGVEKLLQVLTGTWFLAGLEGEGDSLFVFLARDLDTAQVVWWSHEEAAFYGPVAGDLPTVDYLRHHVARFRETGDARALVPVLGRFHEGWPLVPRWDGSDEAVAAARAQAPGAPAYDSPVAQQARYLWWRSAWLAEVLATGVCPDIPDDERALTPAKAMAQPTFASYPPSILYWMWRALLTGDAALDEIVAMAATSPARLVRDAGALVAELAAGTRDRVGAHALAALVAAVRARIEAPLAFPAEIAIGACTLRRDDALASRFVSPAPAPLAHAVPPPSGDFWWATPPGFCPFAELHPAGERLLVQGGASGQAALLEVARDGSGAQVFALLGEVAGSLMQAVYLDADRVLVCGPKEALLVRRGAGVVARHAHQQPYALFTGDLVILHRGPGQTAYPVEILRVDGDRLVREGSTPLALEMAPLDGQIVGRDLDGRRAWVLEYAVPPP